MSLYPKRLEWKKRHSLCVYLCVLLFTSIHPPKQQLINVCCWEWNEIGSRTKDNIKKLCVRSSIDSSSIMLCYPFFILFYLSTLHQKIVNDASKHVTNFQKPIPNPPTFFVYLYVFGPVSKPILPLIPMTGFWCCDVHVYSVIGNCNLSWINGNFFRVLWFYAQTLKQ